MKQELRRLDRGTDDYYYRRQLAGRDLLPAIGAAFGAGLAAFYVVRVLTQRTPLKADPAERTAGRPPRGG
jgi:hypothetical protein